MSTMFEKTEGGDGEAEAGAEQTTEATQTTETGSTDLPDWVVDKYRTAENPIEAQARGYKEAAQALTQKTEDLRGQIRQEVELEIENNKLAPESFTYSEGWEAPAEEIDGRFREWASKNGVSQQGFTDLIEIYGMTQAMPDLEAEKAKLGDDADSRLQRINARLTKALNEDQYPIAEKLMSTAENVKLVERLLGLQTRASPGNADVGQATPANADAMRERMSEIQTDKNWTQDPKKVTEFRSLADKLAKLAS